MRESITADAFVDPFPHIIFHNFYNDEELKLIWQELDFYTKPNKLFKAENYGGVVGYTSAKAILLDKLYSKDFRSISNILTVNRKVFNKEILEPFGQLHDCCSTVVHSNWDITKVRYYHDGDYYDPHTDRNYQFLAFSYFYREPKRFEGGELLFPRYNYEFACDNNSLIMFPGWVEHGVSKVSINDSDYFDGYGRYAITSFFGNKEKE